MNYLDINKKLWDDKTTVHYNSEFYDVKSFLEGKSSLNEIELELLGDVKGKRILHLQCHFGMDSISLSRMGAQVTGVDLSSESIAKARELANKTGSSTRFIECDVYNLPEVLNEKFDIIFTSYGVIGWLPDMNKWASVIQHFLNTGGKLVFVEFHPVVWMFSYDFKKIEYNYSDSNPIIEELEGTYTDGGKELKNKSVSWNHGLANVINSLISKGLRITSFNEYDYSPYDCFENTIEIKPKQFQIKGLENKIPMVYSLVASR